MRVDALPDAEALASSVLRTTLSARVYSSIPSNPTWPLITVKRIGGIPRVRQRLDRARLQIDVWGNSKSETRDLADAARVVLHGMENKVYRVSSGDVVNAVVTGVEDDLGLSWQPDSVTNKDRYIFGVALYTHQP